MSFQPEFPCAQSSSRMPLASAQPGVTCEKAGRLTVQMSGVFNFYFPFLAAFLLHPLSKVQCRKSWAPHICLSLPHTQKCGLCQQYKKEKPKCLFDEVSIFLREKDNTTGTVSRRIAKVCSHCYSICYSPCHWAKAKW